LKVNRKRETDEYGKTHSVSINTWKPDASKKVEDTAPAPEKENADLPF